VKKKNPVAVALAALRWPADLSAEERSAPGKASAAVRFAGMSAAERSAAMRILIQKRWAKRRELGQKGRRRGSRRETQS
jgi:predicted transcriptional regulator